MFCWRCPVCFIAQPITYWVLSRKRIGHKTKPPVVLSQAALLRICLPERPARDERWSFLISGPHRFFCAGSISPTRTTHALLSSAAHFGGYGSAMALLHHAAFAVWNGRNQKFGHLAITSLWIGLRPVTIIGKIFPKVNRVFPKSKEKGRWENASNPEKVAIATLLACIDLKKTDRPIGTDCKGEGGEKNGI